ncbi:hypothetical protein [Tsuneonella suprasediminis]
MCGRSVDEDHIKLQVDHRIPQTWGGTDDDESSGILRTDTSI